ncbi:MAG: hypothetical protein NWF01_11885 [Candidatus Bathyarchaeota archaeon]|nr:hypothetical protein [Candidatus Bathyarchaeota archaeon]
MASTTKFALLFAAITSLLIVAIIGVNLIQPAQYISGTQQTSFNTDPSMSNGTILTVMDGPELQLPEYGPIGSLAGIIACLAAVFVVYQKKKK